MGPSRDHYKVFFETSREGMYITTREGYFVDVNAAFCQLLGYTRLELLRRHVEDTLALPGERRRFRSEIEAQGAVSGFRLKLLKKSGEELACQVHAVVLRDFEGAIDGYIGVIRPVKSAAEPPLFELALRGSQDGLWEWDLRRNDVEYSARWKALLGYASFELGRGITEWFERVHPEDINALKQAIHLYGSGERSVLSAYFRMRNKGGEYLWVLVRAVGEFDEKGRCLRLAGSLSNLTAHIKMIETLKSQEEALSQENHTLAHDRAQLARYFSGDVLARILDPDTASTSEALGPAAIVQVKVNRVVGLWRTMGLNGYATFLNDILTDLMDLAYGRGGSVNKILGDTLLISFGAPLAQEDDLEKAIELAREMLEYLKTFNDVRPEALAQDLGFSIGIAWGEVFSGTLGSVHRVEYSLLGVPVTRAALLQQAAERSQVAILVDDPVRQAVGLRFPLVPAPSVKGAWTLDTSR